MIHFSNKAKHLHSKKFHYITNRHLTTTDYSPQPEQIMLHHFAFNWFDNASHQSKCSLKLPLSYVGVVMKPFIMHSLASLWSYSTLFLFFHDILPTEKPTLSLQMYPRSCHPISSTISYQMTSSGGIT